MPRKNNSQLYFAISIKVLLLCGCSSSQSLENYLESEQAVNDYAKTIGANGYRQSIPKLISERNTNFAKGDYDNVSSLGNSIFATVERQTTGTQELIAFMSYFEDQKQLSQSMADQAYFELAMGNVREAQELFYKAHENVFEAAKEQTRIINYTVDEIIEDQLRSARWTALAETLIRGYSLANNKASGWVEFQAFASSIDKYTQMMLPIEFDYPEVDLSLDADRIRFPVYRSSIEIEEEVGIRMPNGKLRSFNKPFEAIGRVEVLQSSEVIGWCTGTLIRSNIVLTNGHCVTGKDGNAHSVDNIRFVIESSLPPTDLEDVIRTSYGVNAFFTHTGKNKAWDGDPLDDWALLRTDDTFDYWLDWVDPGEYQPSPMKKNLFLAGYSGDLTQGKYITVEWGCAILEVAQMGLKQNSFEHYNFSHNCDSAGGSSGSAIIEYSSNAEWKPYMHESGLFDLKIVGLHHSGLKNDKSKNFGMSTGGWSEAIERIH